ncbi:hypothetical protein P22_2444 [Propionispora sp. 2/2-37]|uniref:DUF2164 domain-containing protein n=1 Tax=Propionispora sp. 2/2-37 TaxID=1677858 RepID=UPI0006BB81B2|nr:DUF2164 domain-containing protein [Propionispora sp. 2/2-37]CUH96354.1 hypothetical protein P22_2444 [Propionispora sp. 2/2-37]
MQDIQLEKAVRQEIMGYLKEFFSKERDEELSDFQADMILDFVIKKIGPHLYNQALSDAHALMSKKIEDIYSLEKRISIKGNG